MKRIYLFIIGYIITLQLSGQEFVREFGKYSGEEFSLKSYTKDTTAEAVVLFDIGSSYFVKGNEGFELYFERHFRIKVFTKAGFKCANIEIPYYIEGTTPEVIAEITGNTYNFENGNLRISQLDKKTTYIEKINNLYSQKKFAMPDIREGSIFEVKYKIKSPYFFNFRSWEFQREIPVLYSKYVTKMIPFYEYTYILQGAPKFDGFKSYVDRGVEHHNYGIKYNDMIYEFEMINLPAFKDEAFISTKEDYITKINFQLSVYHTSNGTDIQVMTTWPKLIKELHTNTDFGKYMNDAERNSKEIIGTLNLANKTNQEKSKALHYYVKENFIFNQTADKFAAQSVKEFLKNKSGNCAEINLFLAGLLKASGLEAYPVILSTRDHGKIKTDFPFHHFFNYVVVITYIDGKPVLLDATNSLIRYGELPAICLNGNGLIINKEIAEWVSLSSTTSSSVKYFYNINIEPENGKSRGEIQITSTNYEAVNYRKQKINMFTELKENLIESGIELTDSIESRFIDDIEKPFYIQFNGENALENVEDKYLISPFFNMAIDQNPFKQKERSYPIDMIYKKSIQFHSKLNLPVGYKILSKTDSLKIDNALIEISYKIEMINPTSVLVTGSYTFKQDIYESKYYSILKHYFNTIVDKMNQKIVIGKI